VNGYDHNVINLALREIPERRLYDRHQSNDSHGYQRRNKKEPIIASGKKEEVNLDRSEE
jgi:hypothetical protein